MTLGVKICIFGLVRICLFSPSPSRGGAVLLCAPKRYRCRWRLLIGGIHLTGTFKSGAEGLR